MSSRRDFLTSLSAIGISSQLMCKSNFQLPNSSDIDWVKIRSHFSKNDNQTLNLNNGSGTNMPIPIMDKYIGYIKEVNSFAPYEILSKWNPQIKAGVKMLSNLLNAEDGCLTIVLNTTSALNTLISGLPFTAGDEIISNSSDYPNAKNSLNIRATRDKLVINELNIDALNLTDDEIVETYAKAITQKTKLVYLTHITHAKGHIFPIARICKIARDKGIETLVDAAHSAGQINHSISDIGCDYYASSLHKWLNAPLGTGLLYVKNDKISKIKAVQSYPESINNKAVKFEYLGTRAFQNLVVIKDVLEYNNNIGIENKQNRFNTLKNYWINKVKDHPKVNIHTDPLRSIGIASFNISGKYPSVVKKEFQNKHNIHIKLSADVINIEPILRVSPDIYTNFEDLDKFAEALIDIAEN